MKEKIEIITRFNSPIMNAKEYIEFSKSLIQHLQKFHPIFETVNSWGSQQNSWATIENNFSNFEPIVLQHIYDQEINYRNPNNQKGFHPESISWAGFSNAYSNTKKAKDAKYTISITAGGEDGLGVINLQLPQVDYDEFYQSEKIKSLINHILQIVQLKSAYVITESLFDQVVDFDKPYDVQIGCLNFFSNKNVLKHVPNGIPTEANDDGCFFWLSEIVDTSSTEVINTATTIRDILGELGYLD